MDPSSTSHWTPHGDAVMIMANSEAKFIAHVDTKARIHLKKPIWSTAAVPGLGLTAGRHRFGRRDRATSIWRLRCVPRQGRCGDESGGAVDRVGAGAADGGGRPGRLCAVVPIRSNRHDLGAVPVD